MMNAFRDIRKLCPFVGRRVKAPKHLLGFPAREDAKPAEHIELSTRRRPINFFFALRDRLERSPRALSEDRANRHHPRHHGNSHHYRSAHRHPPVYYVVHARALRATMSSAFSPAHRAA